VPLTLPPTPLLPLIPPALLPLSPEPLTLLPVVDALPSLCESGELALPVPALVVPGAATAAEPSLLMVPWLEPEPEALWANAAPEARASAAAIVRILAACMKCSLVEPNQPQDRSDVPVRTANSMAVARPGQLLRVIAAPRLEKTSIKEETLLSQLKPPFRAEHIGSLLRPKALLEQRGKFARGEIGSDALTAAEDMAIKDAIALQQRVGLKFATDGEFRRRSYHSFFYRQLGDLSIDTVGGEDAKGGTETGKRASQPVATIKSRVKWTHPINMPDFKFIAANTGLIPKITIPGPCALHFRGGDAAVLASAYKDLDQFWDDTVEAFGHELQALADAGCRYVQIDETAFAKFGDPEVQAQLKARGDDWSTLIDKYVGVTNRVLKNASPGMRIGMHLCRGNRGGQWHSEGSYDDVAERLFNALNIQFYFLEYDSPRAGTFTPLRLVPRHKTVVLGIVSTKTPEMEDKPALKKRIEDAARQLDLDCLAISPQCGFASIDTGNPITPEVQEAKLRLVVELARDIWGEA
jgi:5-methyltetrahydropteroyltriglutamate--homocysteine methyltransferase